MKVKLTSTMTLCAEREVQTPQILDAAVVRPKGSDGAGSRGGAGAHSLLD